jgi:hypothetical protein
LQIHWASRKTWCRHVARFCHPSQIKRNTKSKKHSDKINACSQLGVTWQADPTGFQKCDLGLPLIFFHRGSYNNNSPGTFWYTSYTRSSSSALSCEKVKTKDSFRE